MTVSAALKDSGTSYLTLKQLGALGPAAPAADRILLYKVDAGLAYLDETDAEVVLQPLGITDADTVDGQHASEFAAVDHNHDTEYATLLHVHNPAREFCQIPPYAGGLQTDAGGSGSGENAVTLTTEYDNTNRVLYYNGTTAEADVQDTDIVLQWRLPPEFADWLDEGGDYLIHMQAMVDNDANDSGVQLIEFLDTAGVDCLDTSVLRQNEAWTVTDEEFTPGGGTWTIGGVVTLRIRLFADTGENACLGRITIPWTIDETMV